MPEFLPFAGVRYNADLARNALDALTAPPYDVVDEDQHAALEAADPHNSVRLILPRDRNSEGDRYRRAADTFAAWRAEGVLVADPEPRFYGYRMIFTNAHGEARHTRGVIGGLTLSDDILPHERTLPKAKSDRLALLQAMRVNVDPIWGLSVASGLTALLRNTVPLAECHDADGVLHQLGAIDDPGTIAAISSLVASSPMVLADGHHRFETAINYRNESHDAGSNAIMALVVELADDELYIEAIHRLIDLPAGLDVRARLADTFHLRDVGPITPDAVGALELAMRTEHALGIVDAHGLALARPVRHVSDVDAGVVEELVVPALPEATWQYRNDAQSCAALVDKGAASAAILCSPVSVAQTRAAALAGLRMPQKTTFFSPKPRTGMVFRTLD